MWVRAKWPISAGAYLGLFCMKRLGIFLFPPGWDTSPSQGYLQDTLYPVGRLKPSLTAIQLSFIKQSKSNVSSDLGILCLFLWLNHWFSVKNGLISCYSECNEFTFTIIFIGGGSSPKNWVDESGQVNIFWWRGGHYKYQVLSIESHQPILPYKKLSRPLISQCSMA